MLAKARAEVDAVLGDELPRFEDVGKLRYLEQMLRETLRLWPTAPAFALRPHGRHGARRQVRGDAGATR